VEYESYHAAVWGNILRLFRLTCVSLKETLPDGSLESDSVGQPRGSGLKQLKQRGQEESIYPFRNEITTS
jgi:hypothetical protein